MTEWNPMETAPTDRPVLLKVKGASYVCIMQGGYLDSNERDCSCWVIADDEEPPDCWTDGVCWEVNEDLKQSAQPEGWKELQK